MPQDYLTGKSCQGNIFTLAKNLFRLYSMRVPLFEARMILTALRDKTIDLVRNRPAWLTMLNIGDDTGIGATWINALAKGRIADPSVNKIETILDYFESGKYLNRNK